MNLYQWTSNRPDPALLLEVSDRLLTRVLMLCLIGFALFLPSMATAQDTISRADTAKPITSAPKKSSVLKRLPSVATLSFTGEGVAPKDLSAITNRFEAELLASDSFKVVERRNIDLILKEQGFAQSGACDNSECSVEIGQLLSVQSIFIGQVSKLGKIWSLSVKRTDVGTGQTQFSHVLDIEGSLEDVLRGGAPEMAMIASGKKHPESSRTVLVAKSRNLWPWVAGGVAVVGGTAIAILLSQRESNTSTREVNIQLDTGK